MKLENVNPIMALTITLTIFGVSLIYFFPMPWFLKLILLIVLIMSAYYQIMTIRMGLTPATMVMNIEDRIMNEIAYQVIKRGYYIKFQIKEKQKAEDLRKPSAKWIKRTIEEKFSGDSTDNVYISVVKCNVPKLKRKWIKLISFMHVISRPAWKYREFDDEDDIMYDEELHKDLLPQ